MDYLDHVDIIFRGVQWQMTSLSQSDILCLLDGQQTSQGHESQDRKWLSLRLQRSTEVLNPGLPCTNSLGASFRISDLAVRQATHTDHNPKVYVSHELLKASGLYEGKETSRGSLVNL